MQFAPFLVTILVTVLSDLLVGVICGVISGIIAIIITDHRSAITTVEQDGRYLVRFTRDATFLNKHALRTTLDAIPDGAQVILDGARISFVDPDIYDLIEDFRQAATWRNIDVKLVALDGKLPLVSSSAH